MWTECGQELSVHRLGDSAVEEKVGPLISIVALCPKLLPPFDLTCVRRIGEQHSGPLFSFCFRSFLRHLSTPKDGSRSDADLVCLGDQMIDNHRAIPSLWYSDASSQHRLGCYCTWIP